jgi:uncharacterized protein (DUF1330 family)
MPAYVVGNYAVTNPEAFEPYVPAVLPTIAAGGGEVVVADFESDSVEGSPGHVTVVLKFESKEAINAWYTSEEYEAVKGLRTDNSEGNFTVAEGFVPPAD